MQYNSNLTNIVQVDSNNVTFDIMLENLGTEPQKLCYHQCGINLNYAGLLNGGVITASFVEGSADPSIQIPVTSANVSLNATSKMIRVTAAIAQPDNFAAVIPSTPFRIATVKLTNTNPFTSGQLLNLAWSFATSSSTRTKTGVSTYANGSIIPKDVTVQADHTADNLLIN